MLRSSVASPREVHLLLAAVLAAWFQTAPPPEPDEPELGQIEFSRQASRQTLESIQIFLFEDDERVRYLADIGSGGSRKLTLEAPAGEHRFVVVVQAPNDGVNSGSRSDVSERRRPNVTVDVKAGHRTSVSIGGSLAGARSQGDPSSSLSSVFDSVDAGASQFRTRIRVGKPKRIDGEEGR